MKPSSSPISISLLSLAFMAGLPLPMLAEDAAKAADNSLAYRAQPIDLGRLGPRVGELIEDVSFKTLDGETRRLSDRLGEKGLVIAVRDVECPLSRKYGPRLAQLQKELRPRGFEFLYVNPNRLDDDGDRKKELERYGFAASDYAADADQRLAHALSAQISTEVFVLDAARTLVYRGAIDDQYGLGYTKPAARHSYLKDAVSSVAQGHRPRVQATTASGCALTLGDAPPADKAITYHGRVSRIVQNKCQSCHRPGGVGPFAFTNYDEVADRGMMIQWAVEERVMPPFYAEPGFGPWSNDFSLTDQERADLLAWIESGSPEGDASEAPLPRAYTKGWLIDQPDYVARVEKPFTVPAEGVVDYQYFYVKTDLPEDRWIEQMEIRSSATSVVHHVLIFLESPELMEKIRARRREIQGNPWKDPEYRQLMRKFQGGAHSFFASAAPGQGGLVFPDGMGKKLPAGAWLKFQLHYTPNGEEQTDQSEIGFVFADGPLDKEVRTTSALNTDFVIPAGHPNYEVTSEYEFPEAAAVISLMPHTHLRGTRFLYEAIYPGGRVETLLPLERYDFNWQLNYVFQTPLEVPAGTVLRAKAWFDNSESNPANPDPTVEVTFGEQTFDEMMIGYINWIPLATAPSTVPPKAGP